MFFSTGDSMIIFLYKNVSYLFGQLIRLTTERDVYHVGKYLRKIVFNIYLNNSFKLENLSHNTRKQMFLIRYPTVIILNCIG